MTVTGLEAKSLLERSPDPQDGRRAILTITDKGVEVVRSSRGAITERIAAVLEEHFSPGEVEQIRSAAPLIERLAGLL